MFLCVIIRDDQPRQYVVLLLIRKPGRATLGSQNRHGEKMYQICAIHIIIWGEKQTDLFTSYWNKTSLMKCEHHEVCFSNSNLHWYYVEIVEYNEQLFISYILHFLINEFYMWVFRRKLDVWYPDFCFLYMIIVNWELPLCQLCLNWWHCSLS